MLLLPCCCRNPCDTWHQVEDGETDEEKELEKAGNLLLATWKQRFCKPRVLSGFHGMSGSQNGLNDYLTTQWLNTLNAEGCPEISSSSNLHRCTVHHESTDFPLMKLWECQGSRVGFSRMIIIHHHSIFLFPTPSRCVLASAETFHFAKKGAAEPRAIGPIHRADQRTDAGTPSADQAGQNIAWTHLVASLGVSITAVLSDSGNGWRWHNGKPTSPPSISAMEKCIKETYGMGAFHRIFMTLWSASTAPSFWNKNVRVEMVWNGFISSHRDRLYQLWNPDFFAHQLTPMKVSFFRYLSCRSSRPHILCPNCNHFTA